jgi:hypothetical protein
MKATPAQDFPHSHRSFSGNLLPDNPDPVETARATRSQIIEWISNPLIGKSYARYVTFLIPMPKWNLSLFGNCRQAVGHANPPLQMLVPV